MVLRGTLLLSAALLMTACSEKAEQAPAAAETTTDTDTATDLAAKDTSSIPCPFGETKDWAAVVNAMPGPDGPKLVITGQTMVGSDGYGPVLTLTGYEKIIPPNVLIELNLAEKADGKAGMQEARLEIAANDPAYGLVKISCHGESIYEGEVGTAS